MQLRALCSLLLAPPHEPVRVPSRCTAPVAHQFSEDWMNRLGTATNSKKKWALPDPENVVGPGVVVLAEPGSFDHYFLESIVLVVEHGPDGTRGVLLNRETPWKVEDMSPGAIPPFAANSIFLGGDAGRDTLMMIHGEAELPGAKEIGRGVFSGGTKSAVAAVDEGALPADRFKFFYKTVEWLPDALQMQVNSGVFRLVELSPAYLFGQSGEREHMWNSVRENLRKEEEETQVARAGFAPEASGTGTDACTDAAPTGGEGGGDGEGLAAAASEGAARLRGEVAAEQLARETLEEEEKAMKKAAWEEHDAKLPTVKVRAYVDQIRAEKAAGKPMGVEPRVLSPDLAQEKAMFEARLADLDQQRRPPAPPAASSASPSPPAAAAMDAASGATPAAEPPAAAAPLAREEGREQEEARAFLASRGIFAPAEREPHGAEGEASSEGEAGTEGEVGGEASVGDQTNHPSEVSAAGISQVVAHRTFKGNEQWRVRWEGHGQEGDTWELWQVLDTDELRDRARALLGA